jgi:hypothetical protein
LPRIDPLPTTANPVATTQQTAKGRQDPAQSGTPNARSVDSKNRWMLSSTAARHRLRRAGLEDQAEQRLVAFWEQRHWGITAAAAAYLGQVAVLLSQGAIRFSGRSFDQVPFAPIYRTSAPHVTLAGQSLAAGTLVAFDYTDDRLLTPGPLDGVQD